MKETLLFVLYDALELAKWTFFKSGNIGCCDFLRLLDAMVELKTFRGQEKFELREWKRFPAP